MLSEAEFLNSEPVPLFMAAIISGLSAWFSKAE
jgi:hypothetical protein